MQASVEPIRNAVGERKKIAFVSGNFNVLHPGHLRLLRFAADLADTVVVGLNPDGTQGVTVNGETRLESVKALSLVGHAVLLSEPVDRFISRLQPDFVVKGKEFENRHNVEAAAVADYGGKLIFSSGEMQFASTDLLHREYSDTIFSTIRKPRNFLSRHSFDMDDLRAVLAKFKDIRVAVIGDIIVDDYITCDPLGMSQEDPTIVVSPIETKSFVGGAGVVAAHAHNLGATTRLFSVFGTDETAQFASRSLDEIGVKVHGFTDETRPTTRKQRYRAHNKTLLRVNHLRQHSIGEELSRRIVEQVEAVLPETDLLMFSDFNYGCLPQPLVDRITELARERGVIITADSQASSQMSDISRFRDTSLITPTEHEARLAMQDASSGLAYLAERLGHKAEARNVIVTLGGEGMLIYKHGGGAEELTDRLPAMNVAPKDVAGAGDSLFATTSLALCAGADIWRSAYLGAVAAACQVSRIGNSPLRVEDILTEINQPDFE